MQSILRGTPCLSVRQAAECAGVSERHLEDLVARGALPNARKRWGGGADEWWTIPVIDVIALDILPDISNLPDEAYPTR